MELSHHMKCYALDVWARGSFAGFHEIDESDFGDLFLNQTQKEPGRVTAVTAKEEKTGFQAQWALQGNSESIEGLKMDLGESGEALNVSMILHLLGPAVTRAPPPAFPRNPRGRLGFPGPTQGEG